MKKSIVYIGILLTSVWLCSSCDNFLKLKPRDKKVVSTVEDYRDIMASYMHHIKTPNCPQENVLGTGPFAIPRFDVAQVLGIYTGEISLNKQSTSNYDPNKDEYTVNGKNLLTWLNTDPYVWNQYYEFLGPINLVINGIRTAERTDENLRNYVLGEALVWRAFSYFKLLQYFSPYKDNRYGIPVYLQPYEDVGNAMPERKPQTQVFEQILGDCREALGLMEVTASNDWNCAWRNDFVNAMMASIYTWKAMSGAAEDSDWENAEKCATEAMRGRSLSDSPDVLREMFDCSDVNTETSMNSDEFYFRIMDGDNEQICNLNEAYFSYTTNGLVNPEYYNKFKPNDIRREVYFTTDGKQNEKYNLRELGSWAAGGCIILYRLAEMYLIKAEAMVRQGNSGGALKVMKNFVQARYEGEIQIPSASGQLLQFILDERLREFYLENDFRWLDMKRLGIKMERNIGGITYTLEPDDFRYCFPIPQKEMQLNQNMEQTPGWDKIML